MRAVLPFLAKEIPSASYLVVEVVHSASYPGVEVAPSAAQPVEEVVVLSAAQPV